MRVAFPSVAGWLLLLAAGCDQPDHSPLTAEHEAVPTTVGDSTRTGWTSLAKDADFLGDEDAFLSYINASEVVAVGTLAAWDGSHGALHGAHFLRGQADSRLAFTSTGGFVRPLPGQRVIALLRVQDGKLMLNSFCASGGLFGETEPLAQYIRGSLREKAP